MLSSAHSRKAAIDYRLKNEHPAAGRHIDLRPLGADVNSLHVLLALLSGEPVTRAGVCRGVVAGGWRQARITSRLHSLVDGSNVPATRHVHDAGRWLDNDCARSTGKLAIKKVVYMTQGSCSV